MTVVAFETPGLIDVRAVTIMGAHAKPNSPNPIGYFGTGLKYAIAVIVRLGGSITIWIGVDKFTFSKKESTFRGSPLETIKMTVLRKGNKRATNYELPYTTAYGRNWKPWQAFRELESNTRDEGGTTSILEDGWDRDASIFAAILGDDKTIIVVELPEFVEAAEKINEVFLSRGSRTGTLLEAFDGESDHAYYRTMRAMDLGSPSLHTYNFLEVLELTEDRTLKYNFAVRDVLARWVLTEANEAQVEAVLTAEKGYWEHGLEFPGRVPPSDTFRAVMARRPKGISRSTWGYFGSYSGTSKRRALDKPWALNAEHPRPWKVNGLEVHDRFGSAVFAAPDGYYDDWDRTAQAIVKRINMIDTFNKMAEDA